MKELDAKIYHLCQISKMVNIQHKILKLQSEYILYIINNQKIKKSGCYKNTLYKFRYDVVPEYNLWTFRDNMSTFYFPYDNAEISAAPKMKGDE